jgi:triacylglycerol lipase
MIPPQLLVAPESHPPTTPPPVFTDVELYDTLASCRRVWVRGRVLLTNPPPGPVRSWWPQWRRPSAEAASLPPVQLRTEVSGATLAAEVPLQPTGDFEACFEIDLPPARRGWRVARHEITVAGQNKRVCSVVLTPSSRAHTGLVVVLPLAFSDEPDAVLKLPRAVAAGLADLSRLHAEQPQPCPVYYLGVVPPDAPPLHARLALAAVSLGLPNGHFVLPAVPREEAPAALAATLERLRWLLADTLDLVVVNREPSAEEALQQTIHALSPVAEGQKPEAAVVARFVSAHDSPRAGSSALRPLTPEMELRPLRGHSVPRYPVVFCHGMLAMTLLRMQIPEDTNYFIHLAPFFRERGIRALYPNVTPTGGVVARAAELREQIRAWTDEPVNIIAHSMGGLDARYLITHLDFAKRVRSLTTVSTPHQGTAVADWFCLNFRERVPLLLTLEAFGINVDGFSDCRPAACRAFNAATPDAPGVRYYSYGGAVSSDRVSPLLRRAWNVLTPLEGPNDGLVSVRSAHWGEYLGTLAVDHFGQTPDGLFVRPGENFDSLGFFARLVEDLARRGL